MNKRGFAFGERSQRHPFSNTTSSFSISPPLAKGATASSLANQGVPLCPAPHSFASQQEVGHCQMEPSWVSLTAEEDDMRRYNKRGRLMQLGVPSTATTATPTAATVTRFEEPQPLQQHEHRPVESIVSRPQQEGGIMCFCFLLSCSCSFLCLPPGAFLVPFWVELPPLAHCLSQQQPQPGPVLQQPARAEEGAFPIPNTIHRRPSVRGKIRSSPARALARRGTEGRALTKCATLSFLPIFTVPVALGLLPHVPTMGDLAGGTI